MVQYIHPCSVFNYEMSDELDHTFPGSFLTVAILNVAQSCVYFLVS